MLVGAPACQGQCNAGACRTKAGGMLVLQGVRSENSTDYLSEEQRRNRTKLGIPEGAVRFWATTASLQNHHSQTSTLLCYSPLVFNVVNFSLCQKIYSEALK